MRTVIVRDKEYTVRHSLRALFIYEELSGKPFTGQSLADSYLLCYATLLACNPDTFTLTFSEFIDECDSDPMIFRSYTDMLSEMNRLGSQVAENDDKKKEMQNR